MSLTFESCDLEEICIAAGGTEKLLNELRDKLHDWLKLQPHLPQDISKKRLEWIIVGSKMSLEQAKQKLDMYYTIRRLVPELFANRDPCGPGITALHDIMHYALLPKLTPEKYGVLILRAIVNDPSKYDPWEFHKYTFMAGDIRMVESRSIGDYHVYDLANVSLSHLMKLTPALLKKCEIAASKAYAARIKGIHFLNAPPFVDRLVTMIKSVLKPKIAARVHVHPVGSLESFYQFVPKSILPKDYGGDERSMADLSEMWFKKVIEHRDWFLEQEKVLVNEKLRPGPAVDGDSLFGFSGSFRKLDFD